MLCSLPLDPSLTPTSLVTAEIVFGNKIIFSKKSQTEKQTALSVPENENTRTRHHVIFLQNSLYHILFYRIEVSTFANELRLPMLVNVAWFLSHLPLGNVQGPFLASPWTYQLELILTFSEVKL